MAGLSEKAFRFLKKQAPLKFVATLSEDGFPNVVPVLSTVAWDQETLCFVRFMVWKTRRNLEERKRVAVSGLGLWRALEVLGEFVGFETTGARMDFFNAQAMYRYNAYFGAGQVGVIKVVEEKGYTSTAMWRALQARMLVGSNGGADTAPAPEVMPGIVQEKFRRLLAAKYLSWIDPAGWPRLRPAPGAFSISQSRLGIVGMDDLLAKLPTGTPLALTVFSTEPNAYQVKGRLAGLEAKAGAQYQVVVLEKCYAAGPPLPGEQIYPAKE
jgi:hypothetical protein